MNPYYKTKMKKIIATVIFTSATSFAFSQAADRTSAIMAYNEFTKAIQEMNFDKAGKSLNEAKEYIDKAFATASTDPKTLFYKGEIYTSMPLTLMDVTAMGDAMKDPCSIKPTYKTATGEADSKKFMDEGLDAYKQSNLNKTKKNDFSDQISFKMNLNAITVFNCGSQAFNAKDYSGAAEMFMASSRFRDAMGQQDTLAFYNSALCYERLKDYKNAAEMWAKCAALKYGGADSYSGMANAYRNAGNEAKALESMKAGRTAFPKDQGLIISEVNYHLGKGDNSAAEKAINEAIALDPKNPTLYFALGSVYDNLANPKTALEIGMTREAIEKLIGKPRDNKCDQTTTDGITFDVCNYPGARRVIYDKEVAKTINGDREVLLPKPANYVDDIKKAEDSYKKAIELDSKYFDPMYNLGAMKYNEGAELMNKIKDIADDALYNSEKTKADEKFKQALPFIEKAREINPKDRDNLLMLKNIYARMGDAAKAKEINDLLKN